MSAAITNPMGALYTPPSNVSYFYGRISRDEAIPILLKRGVRNGMFLLRERIETTGSYSLSVCFNNEIHHYRVDRQEDGMVKIDRGRSFVGPVELIKHHQSEADGLITKLAVPCERPKTIQPIYYLFINNSEFYMLVEKEIKQQLAHKSATLTAKQYQEELSDARGRYRYKYEKIVLKNLHLTQAWFKSNMDRSGANELLKRAGLKNGKFLVRSSLSSPNEHDVYKLSVCFNNEIKHYKIHAIKASNGGTTKYALEGGREFDTLIHLVDYYYRCTDGLIDKLREACISVPKSTSSAHSSTSQAPPTSKNHVVILTNKFATNENEKISSDKIYESNKAYEEIMASRHLNGHHAPHQHQQHQHHQSHSIQSNMSTTPSVSNPLESTGNMIGYLDDEPHNPNDITDLKHVPEIKRAIFEEDENYSYDTTTSSIFNIDIRNLEFFDKLGSGCFGSVSRGLYKIKDKTGKLTTEMPVAIKTLNVDEADESKSEIRKEAEIMSKLNFPHIVKFIGMCSNKANCIMIVLELAKLGPLHKYLRAHKEMPMKSIVKICYQVALAMEYLAKKNLVHRDLAARNVLLVSEDLAKVSDFGMSRSMNDSLYYPSKTQGKWPLKWYPPEASQTYRFDEKSDVWSFGVTCWEATSYGARPYQGMDVNILLLRLENGDRLEKPVACPDDVYALMHKCWHKDKDHRPRFDEIVRELRKIMQLLYDEKVDSY